MYITYILYPAKNWYIQYVQNANWVIICYLHQNQANILIPVPGRLIGILYWKCDNPGCHCLDMVEHRNVYRINYSSFKKTRYFSTVIKVHQQSPRTAPSHTPNYRPNMDQYGLILLGWLPNVRSPCFLLNFGRTFPISYLCPNKQSQAHTNISWIFTPQ